MRIANIAQDACPHFTMPAQNLLIETRPTPFHSKPQFDGSFGQLRLKLAFQRSDFVDDPICDVCHQILQNSKRVRTSGPSALLNDINDAIGDI
jgi:hypothetical protein